jgi:hypothetical protein
MFATNLSDFANDFDSFGCIPLGVNLRHIGLGMAENGLSGFQAEMFADHRRGGMPQFVLAWIFDDSPDWAVRVFSALTAFPDVASPKMQTASSPSRGLPLTVYQCDRCVDLWEFAGQKFTRSPDIRHRSGRPLDRARDLRTDHPFGSIDQLDFPEEYRLRSTTQTKIIVLEIVRAYAVKYAYSPQYLVSIRYRLQQGKDRCKLWRTLYFGWIWRVL